MAKDDMHVVAYRILAYLYACMKAGETPKEHKISAEVLGINERYRHDVVEELWRNGYINGACNEHDGLIFVRPTSVWRITMSGVQYMEENTMMQRALKWLRSLKESIPGI